MRSSVLLAIEMTPGVKSEVDSCFLVCLTSISLQIIKDTDFGICLPPDTDKRGASLRTHFPRTKSYSMGIRAVSQGTWCPWSLGAHSRQGRQWTKWLGSGFPPAIFLELLATQPALPGSSASPLILETLSDPCTSRYYWFFLSWLTLVSVTCKQNTLTVKAATQICVARRRWKRRGNQ